MKNYKCASFFAGVGGIDLAFKNVGFETIYANEIDYYAASTFQENFNIKVDIRDINNVDVSEIPDFDIMLAGFPCQAFSLAGYRQGFDDEKGRGTLFFELERIFKAKKPKIIFLENVKIYEHYGFELLETSKIPKTEIVQYSMLRKVKKG